jgi:hypothetical protein
MMQAAEVLTLVHGLHHTFLRHECETREVLLEVSAGLNQGLAVQRGYIWAVSLVPQLHAPFEQKRHSCY